MTNKLKNLKILENHDRYWTDRAREIFEYVDRKDINFFAEMEKIYREQSVSLQKSVFDFYTRFAEDHEISYQDAMNRLRGEDLSDYAENARKYREQAEKDPELLRRLNEQYASARAVRLQVLNSEAVYRAGVLAGALHKSFEKYLYDVAEYAYRKSVGGRAGAINRPAFEEVIKTPFNGRNYSEQLWGNTDTLADSLKKVFRQGFIRGDSPQEMAREIRKEFNVARSRAETLVRTDATAIINRATIKRYKREGLKYYRILVVLDNRTTQICRRIAQEDKLYKLEDAQVGVNMPPFHYNCRSTIMPDEKELDGIVENNSNEVYNLSMRDGTPEYHSKQLFDQISKVEPEITRDMQRIAGKGKLAGLEFRKKTVESLTRKIITDSQTENISFSKAASEINDALRYTTIFNSDTFEKEYSKMKQDLITEGYKVVKVKNTWLIDGPYKGVNTVVEKDGINFEMQYHTRESFDLKNGPLHELYEKYRDTNTSNRERMKLFKEMLDLSNGLEIPKNIERVK